LRDRQRASRLARCVLGLGESRRQLAALSTQRAIKADLRQEWLDAGGAPDPIPDPQTVAAQLETRETALAQLDAAFSTGPTPEDLQGRLAAVEIDIQAEAVEVGQTTLQRFNPLVEVLKRQSLLR
jgi:hypothetical protein